MCEIAEGVAASRIGVGSAIGHHGELMQGAFEGSDGHFYRALVTLPMRTLQSHATFELSKGHEIAVYPADRTKALRAAILVMERCAPSGFGGVLRVRSEIPVGHGYGSSSADVIAAIRAVSNALGIDLLPSTTSEIAVAAESASDAIAYEEEAVLFAHRQGRVIEHFGGSLPPFYLTSFKPSDAKPINTDEIGRARYTAEEIQMFRCAAGAVRRAVRNQDPRLLGFAASLSARISQRHLPKSDFESASAIAGQHDACGVQVSHSGSLIGIIVDAGEPGAAAKAAGIAASARNAGFIEAGVFAVNVEEVKGENRF
ncbi:GHMP family kinase ATP-binding protein [Oryzicola mucosus]|uniref:Kinase n=1 Tax=Oryzicola mucosus TaxID=2767425 RepID=A0A8J6PYT2_9HYPH|nr:kinase [Oryzicola mucosus]MBD0416822.1 kinase [Oryzicola mucosus]